MTLSEAKQLTLDTFRAYSADRGERLAAALAYYATFSLAPLIVLALAVAGLLYGQRSEAAQEELMAVVREVVGTDGAALLTGVLEGAAAEPTTGIWATVLSGLLLVIAATALFATPEFTGITGFLWSRGLSLLLVVGAGIIMVASLVLSSIVAGLADFLAAPVLLSLGERLVSLSILTLLFAVLYRLLPDTQVRWADVWLGALIAAVLATLAIAIGRARGAGRGADQADDGEVRLGDGAQAVILLDGFNPVQKHRATPFSGPHGQWASSR